jgi:ribosomal protein S18 acetylase RimI-like enzyme
MQPLSPDITHVIRSARACDLAGIRFVDPLMRADPDRAHLIQSAVSAGECVVVVDGDEVLGFGILNYTFFQQGVIPLLVVGMGSRRIGIGKALLSELERRCVKSKLYISANRSNIPAQCLFEQCGFVPSGHIENLDLGDDELLFFKPIQRGP